MNEAELQDSKDQAARSKAIAMDLEARLREANESLKIWSMMDAARGDRNRSPPPYQRSRWNSRNEGINRNWRKREQYTEHRDGKSYHRNRDRQHGYGEHSGYRSYESYGDHSGYHSGHSNRSRHYSNLTPSHDVCC